MATIKSFTDLEQSRKLAKILPLKSADMRYGYIAPYEFSDRMYDGGYDDIPYSMDFLKRNPNFSEDEYDDSLPCWSLAALLSVLPYPFLSELSNGIWKCGCYPSGICNYVTANSSIDACYEMIIKLHEQKIL